MKIIKSPLDLKKHLKELENIFLIPTMGNLHEGHLSLIKEAKKISDNIILTIFVNPIQFNSNSDLECYPRTLDLDIDLLKKTGVSIISNQLCGKSRPGHFKGVVTIIDRLFKLIKPSYAIFGKKDYQQLFLIKKFVLDCRLPIKIIEAKTIRGNNSLALSSRNNLLTDKEMVSAAALHKQLKICTESILNGAKINDAELEAQNSLINAGWKLDYFEIRRQTDLKKPSYNDSKLVALGAATFAKVRLLDNIEFCIPTTK
jgi:pantoate--beta-alanine ligase